MKIIFLIVLLIGGGCAPRRLKVSTSPVPENEDLFHDFLLANMEIYSSQPDKALARLDRILNQEKGHYYLWLKRASLRASLGDFKGGLQDLQNSLTLEPSNPESLLLQGKIHQSEGRFEEAAEFYRQLLLHDPDHQEVRYLLVDVYLASKKNDLAIQVLEDWYTRDPDDLQPLFHMAALYESLLKENEKATHVYERILKMDPSNLQALASLAKIYFEKGAEDRAMKVLKKVRKGEGLDSAAQMKIALIYYEAKKYDEAVQVFREILLQNPTDDRVIYYLGVILENMKRFREALQEFAKIPEQSRFYKDSQLHRAYLFFQEGQKGEAVSLLQAAIGKLPHESALYEYLAEIYSKQEQFGEAVRILKEGLKKVPRRESLHYSLGLVYDRAGNYLEGIRAMKEALKVNPNNANALNYIGYTYADREVKGKLDEALSFISRAMLIKPNDGFITDSLGWVYFRMGDFDQAYLYIQKAYDLVPQEPTIAEHLGDLFEKKEEKAKALRYFEESLAILKKNGEDSKVQKEIERLKGKIEKIQSSLR
ncbi:MAG: tetratricopeptide repeat protein [Deltaproteobacteria bacterium]|nr:tetratricopeptide repeat protein [Deltaproteobacteria bacterium]